MNHRIQIEYVRDGADATVDGIKIMCIGLRNNINTLNRPVFSIHDKHGFYAHITVILFFAQTWTAYKASIQQVKIRSK